MQAGDKAALTYSQVTPSYSAGVRSNAARTGSDSQTLSAVPIIVGGRLTLAQDVVQVVQNGFHEVACQRRKHIGGLRTPLEVFGDHLQRGFHYVVHQVE